MKEVFEKLLAEIPDYKEFLTLAELDASSRALAAAHPDCVELFEAGKTVEGRPLLCLKISCEGAGDRNNLMFGCPHPNEPIGTMMLEYFTKALAESEALRREFGCNWYVVKAWDADGLVRNEGWLKGPYDIRTYGRNFFRPAGYKQVDWTFPIDYKKLHFHETLSEAKAMMALIDRIRPEVIYSLHNSGFGGVYWYETEATPAAFEALHGVPARWNVPLSLGTAETPSVVEFAPAIFQGLGIEQEYDYAEKHGVLDGLSDEDVAKQFHVGNNSASYAAEKYGTFTFLTELPYFYDPRTEDTSDSDMTRLEALKAETAMMEKDNEEIRRIVELSEPYIPAEDPFLLAVRDFSRDSLGGAELIAAENDPSYQRPATVTEKLDRTVISRFYKMILFGMLARANENALAAAGKEETEKKAALRQGFEEALEGFNAVVGFLEENLNYTAVPIRNMVGIQLHSALVLLEDRKRSKQA